MHSFDFIKDSVHTVFLFQIRFRVLLIEGPGYGWFIPGLPVFSLESDLRDVEAAASNGFLPLMDGCTKPFNYRFDSIRSQISSLPCFVSAEKGIIISSFPIFRPSRTIFTCLGIWLLFNLSILVAMITGW